MRLNGDVYVYFFSLFLHQPQRLRDLREDADLNQTDIAEYLGIQQTVYSRYERGVRTIPLEHLIRLADFYNVSLDYLVGRTNNTKSNR